MIIQPINNDNYVPGMETPNKDTPKSLVERFYKYHRKQKEIRNLLFDSYILTLYDNALNKQINKDRNK